MACGRRGAEGETGAAPAVVGQVREDVDRGPGMGGSAADHVDGLRTGRSFAIAPKVVRVSPDMARNRTFSCSFGFRALSGSFPRSGWLPPETRRSA